MSYVAGVLRRTRHNGFPVVHGGDADPERDEGEFDELGCGASRSGPLEGVILRSQLLVLLGSQARARLHSWLVGWQAGLLMPMYTL